MSFWKWSKAEKTRTQFMPSGKVAYAVGDIHGSLGLLQAMLESIANKSAQLDQGRPTIIFLGDYVDKGDDPSGVIDALIEAKSNDRFNWVFLKGNHEDALLTFLKHPEFGPQWLQFGGAPTMLSYGVTPPTARSEPEVWEAAAQQLLGSIPSSHMDFYQKLGLAYRMGGYFFVHAGIRPGKAIEAQRDEDLLWIRSEFLEDRRALPVIVVHGHSPDMEPYSDHRRIGVDTGAYATGRLTCVRLEADRVDWLHVTRADLKPG